jgi:hypothetical protein
LVRGWHQARERATEKVSRPKREGYGYGFGCEGGALFLERIKCMVEGLLDMQSFPDCVLQAVESPHGTRFLLCPTLAPSQHPPHASSNSDPCSPECPTAPPWLPEREEEGGKGAGPGAGEGDAERELRKTTSNVRMTMIPGCCPSLS